MWTFFLFAPRGLFLVSGVYIIQMREYVGCESRPSYCACVRACVFFFFFKYSRTSRRCSPKGTSKPRARASRGARPPLRSCFSTSSQQQISDLACIHFCMCFVHVSIYGRTTHTHSFVELLYRICECTRECVCLTNPHVWGCLFMNIHRQGVEAVPRTRRVGRARCGVRGRDRNARRFSYVCM